jgi:hypothetical protein
LSYTGGPRGGTATRTVSRHQSQSQAVNKPAMTTAQRITEHAPKSLEIDRPPAVVTTPPPSAHPKFDHVKATRAAAPVKQ